jgi:hypothetical protein
MPENEWKPNEGFAVGTADGFVQIRIGPQRPSGDQPRIDWAFSPDEARAIAQSLLRCAEAAEAQRAPGRH